MESRLIYKVTHSIHNIEWLNPTIDNGAWIYIGSGAEIIEELVYRCINEHFSDNVLYVSWTRNDSREVLKQNIKLGIEDLLGIHDFSIWDTEFKNVIEFNKNGVMRLGKVIS